MNLLKSESEDASVKEEDKYLRAYCEKHLEAMSKTAFKEAMKI